jgi:signal transduction histidine kinase
LIDATLAASISFIAFGVNFFGAILLLLLNAGSRSVRWYLPFHFCVLIWLLSQAGVLLWPHTGFEEPHAFAIAMLPFMFLLFSVMEARDRPLWHALLALAVAAPLIPIVMDGIYNASAAPGIDAFAIAWSVAGWIGGSLILWRNGRREARLSAQQSNVRRKIVLLAFVLIAPVSVASAILVHGQWFVMVGVPIITIMIMILIFFGITRMQFYDIEVRVRRSGDIATETVESERLAVLGELAATIAHEVRNPLTGVRSLAQRIANEDVAIDKRRQYAAIILEETGRVEKLVSNLLDVARRNPLPRARANGATPLAPLLGDLTLLVSSRAANKNVTVKCDVADNVQANAPREVVAQAVLNLLLNAIAHAPAGSSVEVGAYRDADAVRVVVRDRGPGIPVDERERVFDPFYSTRTDGTGLGLSVVRRIAREYDWTIRIDDAPDGGAQFTLVMS